MSSEAGPSGRAIRVTRTRVAGAFRVDDGRECAGVAGHTYGVSVVSGPAPGGWLPCATSGVIVHAGSSGRPNRRIRRLLPWAAAGPGPGIGPPGLLGGDQQAA